MKKLFCLYALCSWFVTAQAQNISGITVNFPTLIGGFEVATTSMDTAGLMSLPYEVTFTASASGTVTTWSRKFMEDNSSFVTDTVINTMAEKTHSIVAGSNTIYDTLYFSFIGGMDEYTIFVRDNANNQVHDFLNYFDYYGPVRRSPFSPDILSFSVSEKFCEQNFDTLHIDLNSQGYDQITTAFYSPDMTFELHVDAIVSGSNPRTESYVTPQFQGYTHPTQLGMPNPTLMVGDSAHMLGTGVGLRPGDTQIRFTGYALARVNGRIVDSVSIAYHAFGGLPIDSYADCPHFSGTGFAYQLSQSINSQTVFNNWIDTSSNPDMQYADFQIGQGYTGDSISFDSMGTTAPISLYRDVLYAAFPSGFRKELDVTARVLSRTGIWRTEPVHQVWDLPTDVERGYWYTPVIPYGPNGPREIYKVGGLSHTDSIVAFRAQAEIYMGTDKVWEYNPMHDTIRILSNTPGTPYAIDSICIDTINATVTSVVGDTVVIDILQAGICDSLINEEICVTTHLWSALTGLPYTVDTCYQISVYADVVVQKSGSPMVNVLTVKVPYTSTDSLLEYEITATLGGNGYYFASSDVDSGDVVLNGMITGALDLNAEKADMKIYPNPTQGNFTLELSKEGEYSVMIYDLQGRVVHQQSVVDGMHSLPLPQIAGIYSVHVIHQDGQRKTMLIQKK